MDQASRGGRPRVRDARGKYNNAGARVSMMMRQVYYESAFSMVCARVGWMERVGYIMEGRALGTTASTSNDLERARQCV